MFSELLLGIDSWFHPLLVFLSVKVFNQSKQQVNSMDSFIQATYQFTPEAVDALSEVLSRSKTVLSIQLLRKMTLDKSDSRKRHIYQA